MSVVPGDLLHAAGRMADATDEAMWRARSTSWTLRYVTKALT